MPFTLVPVESKKKIIKAGEVLKERAFGSAEFSSALLLANKWRACHAYPINTFVTTLRRKLSNYNNSICAQRLKRMPTIIDKLNREPKMNLTTMQDIGGVRAIVDSIDDVYKLAEEYKSKIKFKHELIRERNYIESPRDKDGYRSIHLIYKYKKISNNAYNGLLIELQIRTKLQHIWATAVETMGTFLGQALKSRQGDEMWLDFFAATSNMFAYMEGSNPLPKYKYMVKENIYQEVIKLEDQLKALEKMSGFSAAIRFIANKNNNSNYLNNTANYYHLIILNSLTKTVRITPFGRNDFQKAADAYVNAESEVAKGARIEPILVSAGPINNLKRAYPNFFLDIDEFVKILKDVVASNKKS